MTAGCALVAGEPAAYGLEQIEFLTGPEKQQLTLQPGEMIASSRRGETDRLVVLKSDEYRFCPSVDDLMSSHPDGIEFDPRFKRSMTPWRRVKIPG